jgi:beta-glucosidase
VSFQLPVNLLAFYDENLELVVEAGPVEVMLGSSSEDIRFTSSLEISGAAKTPIAQRLFGCEAQVS